MVWKLHTKSIKDIKILQLDGVPSARILYTCANHALWNHTNKGFIPLKLSVQYKSVVSVSETTTVVSVCIKYQDKYLKYFPLLNIQATYFVWKLYSMSVILKHSTALKLIWSLIKYSLTLKRWSLCSSTQLIVWSDELWCGLRGTPGTAEFTTLMQVIVLPLAYRCRQRLSRWLYQRWPALAGNGRLALSPAQPLPARKAKILLAVL